MSPLPLLLALQIAAPQGGRGVVHKASADDNFERISLRYFGDRGHAQVLRAKNPGGVRPGALIIIPSYYTLPLGAGSSLEDFARRHLYRAERAGYLRLLLKGPKGTPPLGPATRLKVVDSVPYRVRGGDSWTSIARRFYGGAHLRRRVELLRAYNLTRGAVSPGRRLRLPLDGPEYARGRLLARKKQHQAERPKAQEDKRPAPKRARKPRSSKQAAARRAAERKAADRRAAEKRAAEKRAAEKKAAEKRAAEKKAAEKRAAEKRAAEKKAAEKRAAKHAAEKKHAARKPTTRRSSKIIRRRDRPAERRSHPQPAAAKSPPPKAPPKPAPPAPAPQLSPALPRQPSEPATQPAEAVPALDVPASEEKSDPTTLRTAQTAYRKGAYRRALALAHAGLRTEREGPGQIPLLKLIASCQVALGEPAQATASFRRILKLDPRFSLDPKKTSPKILDALKAAR